MKRKSHRTIASQDERKSLVLVGNPNVGKSVIFGLLTGQYVTVSNYPGTTVEIAQGKATLNRKKYVVTDTPGANNLLPMSEDERVTRDILLYRSHEHIIQIADAKNLKRALLLTLQLLEAKIPFVLVLNMMDEARDRGIKIDHRRLAKILGVKVIPTVAIRRQGITAVIHSLDHRSSGSFQIRYSKLIEDGVNELERLLPEAHLSKRSLALMILGGDESLTPWLQQNLDKRQIAKIEAIRQSIQAKSSLSLSYLISKERLDHAEDILNEVYTSEPPITTSWKAYLGKITMHSVWGVPILLAVLYLIYLFVGKFGAGTVVDFLEEVVFGKYINPGATQLAERILPIPLVKDFLVGEYGVITMALSYGFAIILPIVGTFFIAFSLLEDCGYLPRLAVMVNRIFRVIGLNGKAVLPMVLGLGCDTMATMTARILETRKERIIVTLLLALGIPCSAQLGVILGMVASISPLATLLWAGVVIAVIVIVGYLAAKVIPGESSDFLLELPPIRVPQFFNILNKTMARIEWYLKEVVPLFILATAILFIFDKLHILTTLQRLASPVVQSFLGLPAKATDAFLIGFLRRDYGAAGLYTLARDGLLNPNQIVVALITITLFVPCFANLLMIIKERGWKTAAWMALFIFPFSFLVGGLVNMALHIFRITL